MRDLGKRCSTLTTMSARETIVNRTLSNTTDTVAIENFSIEWDRRGDEKPMSIWAVEL